MLKRLADQTLYEILEVPPDASSRDIAEAVERARALYGPGSIATYTLMSNEEATLLTRRIAEAQSTLLDPDARARYDEGLGDHPAPGGNGHAAAETRWPPVLPAVRVLPLVPEPDRAEAEHEAAEQAEESWPLRPGRAPGAAEAAAEPAPPPPSARPPPIPLRREVNGPAMTPIPLPSSGHEPAAPIPLVSAADAPQGVPPPDATAWTGEVLRRLREARGITLQQLSERIKVTRHHIENIEGDRFTQLPAPVYLRGILLSVARELRLDGQKVARSYLERVAQATGGPGAPKAR